MIKSTGSDENGKPVLLLGLSYKNLKRLQADEPIMFDGSPYGYPGKIMLFAGPTEAAMARMSHRTPIRASSPTPNRMHRDALSHWRHDRRRCRGRHDLAVHHDNENIPLKPRKLYQCPTKVKPTQFTKTTRHQK